MKKQFFGTDGIRGIVGKHPMTPEFVLKLGQAAGCVFKKQHARAKILIGKDTRLSGYMFESALEAGFAASGADVYLVGPLPTPAVAYLTKTLRMTAGIVISASHNSFEDNGIKFFSSDGEKLPDSVEWEIENLLNQNLHIDSQNIGKATRIEDARGRYIEFCKSTFFHHFNLKHLKIVVDCANGAAYQTAPLVFEELGAKVIPIFNEPNGLNINHSCGSTHPCNLQQIVLKEKADLGIAFDGDADRLHVVDSFGKLYDGDALIYAIAKNRHQHHNLQGVVGTQMSNLALENALKNMDVPFLRANVGDRYVFELLRQKNWCVGGENSGHILLLDKHTTGDACIAALEVLSVLCENNADLPTFLGDFHLFPQVLENVQLHSNHQWQNNPALQNALAHVQQRLQNGRVLLRASGTEPLLRIMVEGENVQQVQEMALFLKEVAQKNA